MRALCLIIFIIGWSGVVAAVPGSCKSEEFFEPSAMVCLPCPGNASLVASDDGYTCSCEAHSVPISPGRCKSCGPTAIVSTDGTACVPRHCQVAAGRTVCRRCPADYISVTQNFDGSPMKEVLCVKCARGFRARDNACVRCASCACARTDVALRGACVPQSFVNARPKYEGTMHPSALQEVVKLEYLCIQNDYKACRTLAAECVKNFYSNEAGGPCRLWLQPSLIPHKGLPHLLIESGTDKDPGIDLPRGEDSLKLALAIYTADGGLRMLQNPGDTKSCFSSMEITIGKDYTLDCPHNVSEIPLSEGDTLSLFLQTGADSTPLPVGLRKPNGDLVKRSTWPTDWFRRYFVIHNALSKITNSTVTIYLRTLQLQTRLQRSRSSIRVHLTVEAQYATKSAYARSIVTSLRVAHEMPSAGVLRGLEIWGGVLGALSTCYAVVQWRGALRRGALQASLLPILAGAVADAIYFAAWLSVLHALAAEAGSLGLMLPPSRSEEHLIRALVYSAVSLKVIKVAWINWRQCTCDIFFLDWSEYNPPSKDGLSAEDNNKWKATALAREWSAMQAKRRVSPGFTAAATLALIHLATPWLSSLHLSRGYLWAVGSLAWWVAYSSLLVARWTKDKLTGPPTLAVARVCEGVGMSLLVFQEEYYAHYIHGRNNEFADAKSMSGALEAGRVACAPQLRVVYKQLSTPGLEALGGGDTRKVLMSRFLAAFFERALDGLSWVASERTVLERLLDIEVVAREAGNTSALLYDPDDGTPSCFAMAWWGEEWSLATLDAMLFGCVLVATGDWLVAGLVTVVVWQVSKQTRTWFGDKNLKQNIGIELL